MADAKDDPLSAERVREVRDFSQEELDVMARERALPGYNDALNDMARASNEELTSIYGTIVALADARLAGGWRPIETAPRDGRDVVILYQGEEVQARYFPGEYKVDHEGVDDSTGAIWCCVDDRLQIEVIEMKNETGGMDYDESGVTHWRPLTPRPPA